METTEFWKKHNYELVRTEDHSPTLRWLGSETQETMHHRGGAYSETQLIYGEPLRESLQTGGRSAVSVGLGLGYNEILVAGECLRRSIAPDQFYLLSYEADAFLREHFINWLQSSEEFVYDEILTFFKKDQAAAVKSWLLLALKAGTWSLQGALQPSFEKWKDMEVVFYDAFSSKTSPHLWQEDFLNEFMSRTCAPQCQFSTYACTGALKRALKANGFEVVIREGFQSKRNSTLGIRRSFSNP